MDVTLRMSLHKTHIDTPPPTHPYRHTDAHTHTHTHCTRICDKTQGSGSSATSVPRDAHPIFTGFLGLRHICTTLLEFQWTRFPIIYIQDVHKWDNSVGRAARYFLDGSGIEFRWGRRYYTRPERPCGPPSFLYNGYQVFSWGEVAGKWRWPSTLSSAEVKERVEVYFYSPLDLRGLAVKISQKTSLQSHWKVYTCSLRQH